MRREGKDEGKVLQNFLAPQLTVKKKKKSRRQIHILFFGGVKKRVSFNAFALPAAIKLQKQWPRQEKGEVKMMYQIVKTHYQDSGHAEEVETKSQWALLFASKWSWGETLWMMLRNREWRTARKTETQDRITTQNKREDGLSSWLLVFLREKGLEEGPPSVINFFLTASSDDTQDGIMIAMDSTRGDYVSHKHKRSWERKRHEEDNSLNFM